MTSLLDVECHKRELIYRQAASQEELNRQIIYQKLEKDYKSIMTKEDSELFQVCLKINWVKSYWSYIPMILASLALRKTFIEYPMHQQFFIFGTIMMLPIYYNQFFYPPRRFKEMREFYYFKYVEKANEMLRKEDEEVKKKNT